MNASRSAAPGICRPARSVIGSIAAHVLVLLGVLLGSSMTVAAPSQLSTQGSDNTECNSLDSLAKLPNPSGEPSLQLLRARAGVWETRTAADTNGNSVSDCYETAANRSFLTVPPWQGASVAAPIALPELVSAYVYPRLIPSHRHVRIALQGTLAPPKYSVAIFRSNGRPYKAKVQRVTTAHSAYAVFRVPASVADTSLVVRLTLPHTTRRYAVVKTR